jgi:hypothetical protein
VQALVWIQIDRNTEGIRVEVEINPPPSSNRLH